MSKIKPQIKKNNPSHYSTGWRLFGAAELDLEKWC